MVKVDIRQQKALDNFFAEQRTWYPDNYMNNYIAALLIGLSMMLLVFPWNSVYDGDITPMLIMPSYLYLLGVDFIAAKYRSYSEFTNGKKGLKRVSRLIAHLPVDRIQLVYYKINKIWKVCFVTTFICIAVRILISCLAYGNVSPLDIVLPLIIMIILPVFSTLIN
ncbi:MAG: hypothetical protein ACI4D1_03515 [Lachnospira sp.]